MKKAKGRYIVGRSAMHVGMKTVGDAFHVKYESADEEQDIASFWIRERQPVEVAEKRANRLATTLNHAIVMNRIVDSEL